MAAIAAVALGMIAVIGIAGTLYYRSAARRAVRRIETMKERARRLEAQRAELTRQNEELRRSRSSPGVERVAG